MTNPFYLFLSLIFLVNIAVGQDNYRYELDLNAMQENRLFVTLTPPKLNQSKYTFHFPKTVPGTYATLDYGRMVSSFQAFDDKGKNLKVKKEGENTFLISGKNLSKITYQLSASWDTEVKENKIFEPAGTNFEKGKNFILNHGGIFGYFEGSMMKPYELQIKHPESLFGASALDVNRNKTMDVWKAESYVRLADSPIMYAPLDTAIIKVGNTEILISCYSVNKNINAKDLIPSVQPTVNALNAFLKGLPVNRYAFLFYFAPMFSGGKGRTGAFGALEHSYCSLYYLPEMAKDQVVKQVNDVCSHEFLHIITPLNLHSKEIHEFNFASPKMSQHLWLYEGSTEYYAHLIQLRANMISFNEFCSVMRGKIQSAETMDKTLSFTKMSANILKEDYHKSYNHVYDKGALLCMGLDMEIMRLTQGKMTLRKTIEQLSAKYGVNKPFEDDVLFKDIVAITHPEVQKFITSHIVNSEPLNYATLMKTVGVEYQMNGKQVVASLEASGIEMGMLEGSRIQIVKANPEYDLKYGDFVKTINGVEISLFTALTIAEDLKNSVGKPVTIMIEREGKTIEIKKMLKTLEEDVLHSFTLSNTTDATILLCRKLWMTND